MSLTFFTGPLPWFELRFGDSLWRLLASVEKEAHGAAKIRCAELRAFAAAGFRGCGKVAVGRHPPRLLRAAASLRSRYVQISGSDISDAIHDHGSF
jgi:hypothetical protein